LQIDFNKGARFNVLEFSNLQFAILNLQFEIQMPLSEYLLRLGDDRLILGHRLSEWCGHGPILEEDIALANMALDLIGQANLLLELAGKAEGQGKSADSFAYFREGIEFRNALIVELPRGDFAFTIARQFLVSVFEMLHLEKLQSSAHSDLAGIAAKAFKETRYHARHSADWMLKLGDGTADSHDRVQKTVNELWRFTGELFEVDDVERDLVAEGIAPDRGALRESWRSEVARVLQAATLTVPDDGFMQRGGRDGRHTEHLGLLLAEMQIVARSFPGAEW
jgi:ring-1,2-phenylacetyl-CoA epoxidase subunit PaaC